MTNRKKGMRTRAALVAGLVCMGLLSGCSNVGEHSNTYFKQMSNVVSTAISSQQAIAAAEAESSDTTETVVDENALSTPADFVVNEDGTYSFSAVENAQYYYIYVYESTTSMDASTQSEKILDDGSDSYSGTLSDLGTFTYQTWDIRVVAYPDYENTDYTASAAASCEYVVTGEVEYGEPTFSYMWTVTSGALEVKVSDMEYTLTAYPEEILLTLTNTADSSDVVTIDITDVDSTSASGSTTDVQEDAAYAISAEFIWDEDYVTNPDYTMDGGEAETSSTENLISGEFYYSSAIFNNFDFPHVYEGFDPEEGGLAGVWYIDSSTIQTGWGWEEEETDDEEETDNNCYFYATPIDAEDGALYSYSIMVTSPGGSITATPLMSPGSNSTDAIFGYMNIYDDGTFTVEIEYQYISTDMMNAATYYVPGVMCEGVYVEEADGTLTLSYDHENAYETDYDIVTEVTGQAAEYQAAQAEEEAEAAEETEEAEVSEEAEAAEEAEAEADAEAAEEGAEAEAEAAE